jgi:hypothetical protein
MDVIARLDVLIERSSNHLGLLLKHCAKAGGYRMPRLKRGMTRVRFTYFSAIS